MPACMAHYLFGQDVLEKLDSKLRVNVAAHPMEYSIGLQGPDIFFFYKPYRKTRISEYGVDRHRQTASRMFGPILEKKLHGTALSYLMGLICHYSLDSSCHPYVKGNSQDNIDHQYMESAFDKYLMIRRNIKKPRYLLIPDSGLDFVSIASLWQEMQPDIVSKCIKSMRFYTRMLEKKKILIFSETILGKSGMFSSLALPDNIPKNQLKNEAIRKGTENIREATIAAGSAMPCPPGFYLNYEGEIPHEQAGEKLDSL